MKRIKGSLLDEGIFNELKRLISKLPDSMDDGVNFGNNLVTAVLDVYDYNSNREVKRSPFLHGVIFSIEEGR